MYWSALAVEKGGMSDGAAVAGGDGPKNQASMAPPLACLGSSLSMSGKFSGTFTSVVPSTWTAPSSDCPQLAPSAH